MKRLTPPILKVYTDSQLAVELDIPHWKIKAACENGDIEAHFEPARIEFKPRDTGPGFVRYSHSREGGTKYSYPAYYTISRDEALRVEAELFQPSVTPEPATGEMHPKEKDSLLKLIAVMAVDSYKYDRIQKRSAIPGEIVLAAENIGINLDEKTVRKWLKIAAETHISTDNTTPS